MPGVSGPTRPLAITYNGYSVGGSTGRPIHGFTAQSASKDRASVTFDVVIFNESSDATFAATCAAIEAAYRTPFQSLTVSLGSSTLIAASQSSNTGLDAIASIEVLGGPPDSARSRGYRVHIEYGLPATWATISGLRDSSVDVTYGPMGQAIVTMRGTFTAVSSNDALAQHDAQVATFVSNTKSWLSITSWDLVDREVTASVNRKTCEFRHVYEEAAAVTVTYNSYALGGSGKTIHGLLFETSSMARASVSCEVLVTAASDSALATACAAIEAAFSVPFKDLVVAIGGNNVVNVTQSGSTGLDALPSIEGIDGSPGVATTDRVRRYRVRVEYGLPATWAATAGLRDSSVSVAYTPAGQASVTMRGTFTATAGGGDAKAVHDGAIGTWASAQMTWLGITTYQLVGRPDLTVSVNRKTAEFTRVYQETFAAQAVAGTVVRQVFTVTRGRKGSEYIATTSSGASSGPVAGDDGYAKPGGPGAATADVIPLTEVTATYEAWIDKAVSTDLPSVWDAIQSWVISQVASIVGTASFGMMSAAPSYVRDENRITATITGVVYDTDGVSLISNEFKEEVSDVPGWDFLPLWTGDPLDVIAYQGSRVITRTTSRRWREVQGGGGGSGTKFTAGGPANSMGVAATAPGGGTGGTWYPLSQIGTPDAPMTRHVGIGRKPFVVMVTENWYTVVERFAKGIA